MCGALAISSPRGVEQRAREVEPLLDVHRVGGVLQPQAHLLGDVHEQVVEDLQHHRVGRRCRWRALRARLRRAAARGRRRASRAARACQPGSTTVVALRLGDDRRAVDQRAGLQRHRARTARRRASRPPLHSCTVRVGRRTRRRAARPAPAAARRGARRRPPPRPTPPRSRAAGRASGRRSAGGRRPRSRAGSPARSPHGTTSAVSVPW